MNVEDIKFLHIFYRILPEFYQTGIPSEYCWTINEIIYVIQNNIQYRIIFVCRSDNIPELDALIRSNHIYKIYIFGNCTRLDIKNKEVKIVNTNECNLMLDIMCSAIDYIHDEEIIQRKLRDHRMADKLTNYTLDLFDLVETLYFTNRLR